MHRLRQISSHIPRKTFYTTSPPPPPTMPKLLYPTSLAFDPALRELTHRTISETRAMLSSGTTPSARYEARRCDACSLIDLCQPQLLGRGSVEGWLRQQLEAEEE